MANLNTSSKRFIISAIGAFSFFLHGAMAQAEDENPDPDKTKTEHSDAHGNIKTRAADPLKGFIVTYIAWQSPRPLLSFWIPPVSQVLLDIVDGRNIVLRQETITKNNITLHTKTWEHEVTSAKACPKPIEKTTPLQDAQCIIGRKNIIRLPQDTNPFNLIYTVEWIEGNKTRTITAPLNAKQKPLAKKALY